MLQYKVGLAAAQGMASWNKVVGGIDGGDRNVMGAARRRKSPWSIYRQGIYMFMGR